MSGGSLKVMKGGTAKMRLWPTAIAGTKMRKGLRRFLPEIWLNKRGNVAMMFAITLPLLAGIVGFAIDIHRAVNAKTSAQEAADATVLAALSSIEQTAPGMQRVANQYLAANADYRYLNRSAKASYDQPRPTQFRATVNGSVNTVFMGLFGITTMPIKVSATGERGTPDRVELALVLDNTWSMSEADGAGSRKIDALKSASRMLIEQLMQRSDGAVRMAVVPYADYVNVGVSNRSQSWLSVPRDYSTTSPRVCKTNTTRRQCRPGAPRTCTRSVDGIEESYNCTPSICTDVSSEPYETCSGGGTTNYRWYGCVGSRKQGQARLNEDSPQHTYPGLLATKQNCVTPITLLTDRKQTLLSAVQNMVVNVGSYRPLTYLPSGLIWGVNALTAKAPLVDGLPADPGNRDPRKIIVLMTDGANTLRFVPSTGEHSAFSTNGSSSQAQLTATNADTAAICDYAKSLKIEIFTVALAVDSDSARDLLRKCASDSKHYFDARDTRALADSFNAIAASVHTVRLVK